MRIVRAAVVLPVLALLHIHLHHHFHGPAVDYVGLAAGAAASWVGVPGPGEPLLIAAGVLAARHRLDIGSVVFVAWAAATVGGIVGWWIGRAAGRGILTARGPLQAARIRAVERGEQVFDRRPVLAILLTPSWVAGINRARGTVFHPTNAASAALWAGGIGVGAYLIGPSVLDFVDDLGTILGVILVVAVLCLVVLEVRRRRRGSVRARSEPS